MPESSEILYLKTLLSKEIKNHKLLEIEKDNKIIKIDETIKEIGCKGKLLWLELENEKYVEIHLGLTGWLYFDNDEGYIRTIIKIDGNKTLYMADKINLGEVKLVKKDEHNKRVEKLGVYIFDEEFTEEKFEEIVKSKKKIISNLLMDQNMIAGIGNYIRNEALYLSGIDPKIKSNKITDDKINDLYDNILFVAYSVLMTYLKDDKIKKNLEEKYKKNMPKNLEVPYNMKIYGKEKVGNKNVKIIKISGRDTYILE